MQELGRDSTDLFDQKHSQHKSELEEEKQQWKEEELHQLTP